MIYVNQNELSNSYDELLSVINLMTFLIGELENDMLREDRNEPADDENQDIKLILRRLKTARLNLKKLSNALSTVELSFDNSQEKAYRAINRLMFANAPDAQMAVNDFSRIRDESALYDIR